MTHRNTITRKAEGKTRKNPTNTTQRSGKLESPISNDGRWKRFEAVSANILN